MAFGSEWIPPLVCARCGEKAGGGDVFSVDFSEKTVFCHDCAPKKAEPEMCPTCGSRNKDFGLCDRCGKPASCERYSIDMGLGEKEICEPCFFDLKKVQEAWFYGPSSMRKDEMDRG